MSIAPLLQRFIDDELALAPALSAVSLVGTIQLLGPSKDAARRRRTRPLRRHRRRRCSATPALYEKTFVESLRRQIAEDLDTATRALAPPRRKGDGLGLELMDESRVEVDIEISRAMQLIDSTAEWELRELQTFTSTLVGPEARHRRVEPVSTARLRDRALGRRLRHRRLADPARDRPAHRRPASPPGC